MTTSFRERLRANYDDFLTAQARRFPSEETLRIDLHCHDLNSDVPDELWGRILRLPETWLETEQLAKCLKNYGTDLMTITNHNNARSCWDMQDKGIDVLVGAEFTCHYPDLNVAVHVLTYGFTPAQEEKLKKLRKNVYHFAEYTAANNLPTVVPHPLYFYTNKNKPSMDLFEKHVLMFERFEVLNGQRDLWQNMLAVEWLQNIDEAKIDLWQRKHGLNPANFCRHPYRKRFTGGSDDHMGIFAGSSGTMLHVPDLARRRQHVPLSQLALEALLDGDMAPYGHVLESEKLSVSLLDYFCQVAINMEDPGLFRMFLHRGSLRDKVFCLIIGNAMQELKRHNYTLRFFKTFHDALSGKKPHWLVNWKVAKDYKPILADIVQIAQVKRQQPERYADEIANLIPNMFRQLGELLVKRVGDSVKKQWHAGTEGSFEPDTLVRKFEVPSHVRSLFSSGGGARRKDMTAINLADAADKLSFPALATGAVCGASFMAVHSMYKNRAFLNQFAEGFGRCQHPKRALWLTDTLFDKNGVSSVLQSTLDYVRQQDLPIDFLVCSNDITSGPHLHVVKALGEFSVPNFGNQMFRVPNILDIQKIFLDGGYDRVICSTELLMGLVAQYLKNAFQVPAYFYMHTDWLDFFQRNTKLETQGLDRVRRVLRAFYKCFNGVFVLNTEHRQWLTGAAMGLRETQVFKTAHWVEDWFEPCPQPRDHVFPGLAAKDPVLLFVGRLSEEKGVMDLVDVLAKVRQQHPRTRLVFAGTGPAENRLREALPDALFLGWVDRRDLPRLYSAADLLILPSRFDTFGCVVLEAMKCALPVAAYDTKGPRDIIVNGVNGLLADTAEQMGDQITAFLSDKNQQAAFKSCALFRSTHYRAEPIMHGLLRDTGLRDELFHGSFPSVDSLTTASPTQAESGEPTVDTQDENLFHELLDLVNIH